MKCEDFETQVDDYISRDLIVSEMNEMDDHVIKCTHCSAFVVAHKDYLVHMGSLRPDHSTGARAMNLLHEHVVKQEAKELKKSHHKAFYQGFIAASFLAVVCMVGLSSYLGEPADVGTLAAQGSSHITYKNGEVSVVIFAPENMSEAMLSLALPDGMEIEGYEGFGYVQWPVSLKEGLNTLSLPVYQLSEIESAQTIYASLSYGENSRAFTLDVNLEAEQSSDSLSTPKAELNTRS